MDESFRHQAVAGVEQAIAMASPLDAELEGGVADSRDVTSGFEGDVHSRGTLLAK
jgi:hypothetical protein